MATTEDVARLTLEAEAKGFEATTQVIASAKSEVYELADSYDLVETNMEVIVAAAPKMRSAVSFAMEDIAEKSKRAAESVGKVGAEAKKSGANLGNAALEGSRALEDLQYGIGGVVNNIPGLVMALGGGAGLTAIISVLAVGVAQLVKHWGDLAGMFGAGNPIPEATTSLARHDEELKKVNKSLDELKEKTSLSNEELAKYNELTKEQAALEAKIAQDRKNEANAKSHGEHANQADREAASGFAKALDEAGGYDAVVERFTRQLASELKASEFQIPGLRKAIQDQFSAALEGDQKAIRTIARTSATDRTGLTGMFDTFIDMYSPETMLAQEKEKARDATAKANDKARAQNGGVMPLDPAMEAAIKSAEAREKAELAEKDVIEKRQQAMEAQYGSEAEAAAAAKDAPKQAAARRQENLARQIYNASGRMTGFRFTPDQSRAAAKTAIDLVGKDVGLNDAVQAAMGEQLQAMEALANRIQQHQVQMMQLGRGFGQISRFMGGLNQTNLNFGMQ